jgi:hypothetical protein
MIRKSSRKRPRNIRATSEKRPARRKRVTPVFAPFRAGRLPRIKCPAETEQRLIEIARSAGYIGASPGSRATLEDILEGIYAASAVAQEAITWLVHRKVDSTPVAEFRAMVSDKSRLRKTLEQLAELLPDTDAGVPWAQMRTEFIGGNPFSDGLAAEGDAAKEEEWEKLLHPRKIRLAAIEHLRLIRELEDKARGTRPHQVPEKMFVQTLAHFWTNGLRLPIQIKRRGGGFQGYFVDFVEKVVTLYPLKELKKAFPGERVALGSLTGHLLAVEREHKSRPKGQR